MKRLQIAFFGAILISQIFSCAGLNKAKPAVTDMEIVVTPEMTLQLKQRDGSMADLPLTLECKSGRCHFVLGQSGYALKEFTFSRGDLSNAKIYLDSMTNTGSNTKYLVTDIVVKSKRRDKSIGISLNNNKFLFKAFETMKGSEIKQHQEFLILNFDPDGNLVRTYTEYLY